jgi:hypothetical protein
VVGLVGRSVVGYLIHGFGVSSTAVVSYMLLS